MELRRSGLEGVEKVAVGAAAGADGTWTVSMLLAFVPGRGVAARLPGCVSHAEHLHLGL